MDGGEQGSAAGAPGDPASADEERRTGSRLSDRPPVRLTNLAAEVYDISRTGACLLYGTALPIGEALVVELQDELDGSLQSVAAVVVWWLDGRLGLRWAELTPDQDRWLLDRFQIWLAARFGDD